MDTLNLCECFVSGICNCTKESVCSKNSICGCYRLVNPKKKTYKLMNYTQMRNLDGGDPTNNNDNNNVSNITTIVLTKPMITEDMAKQYMKDPDKAFVDIEEIKNVGGVVRQSKVKYTPQQRQGLRKWISWAYRGFKVVLGGAAMVVSFGGGGDTCTDMFFLIVDTAFLVANISSILVMTYEEQFALTYVKQIYDIQWIGDPLDIQMKMNVIFQQIDLNPNFNNVYTIVCQKYYNILDTFAAAFGDLISALIPDDAGIARIVVEMIIMEGANYLGKKPFDALTSIYNTIPTGLKNVLMNEKNLKEFIITIVSFFRNLLPTRNDSFWTKFKKNVKRFVSVQGGIIVGLLIPGVGPLLFPLVPVVQTANALANFGITGEFVIGFLDKNVEPMVDSYCKFMMRVIPLVFAVILVFDHCKYKA